MPALPVSGFSLDIPTEDIDALIAARLSAMTPPAGWGDGSGAAASVFACRAWLRYNGVTDTVLGSGNVASVTKNGTGDYTINFTEAMPDANYCAVVTGDNALGATLNTPGPVNIHTYDAGFLRILATSNASTAIDYAAINVAVYGSVV